jgi:transposase-like protein
MTKPIARDPIYCRRHFEAEIIELCVRWYITYRLSCPYLNNIIEQDHRAIRCAPMLGFKSFGNAAIRTGH